MAHRMRLEELWASDLAESMNLFVKESGLTAWRKIKTEVTQSKELKEAGWDPDMLPPDLELEPLKPKNRTFYQHLELCEAQLLRQYYKILIKATCPQQEDVLDVTLKGAFAHSSGPDLTRAQAEQIVDEMCIEAIKKIAKQEDPGNRQLVGTPLFSALRLATRGAETSVRSASLIMRSLGSVVRTVAQQARRCMEAELLNLEKEEQPLEASPRNQLKAIAELVGISKILHAPIAGGGKSTSSVGGLKSKDNPASALEQGHFLDLEMVCRQYQLKVPEYLPPNPKDVSSFKEILELSKAKIKTAEEYHSIQHTKFNYTYKNQDSTCITDSCFVQYAESEAQTNLKGDVAPAHLSMALRKELEQAQLDRKMMKKQLKQMSRRNELLNEEQEYHAKKDHVDNIRKSVFELSSEVTRKRRKSTAVRRTSTAYGPDGRPRQESFSAVDEGEASMLRTSASFHFGTSEADFQESLQDNLQEEEMAGPLTNSSRGPSTGSIIKGSRKISTHSVASDTSDDLTVSFASSQRGRVEGEGGSSSEPEHLSVLQLSAPGQSRNLTAGESSSPLRQSQKKSAGPSGRALAEHRRRSILPKNELDDRRDEMAGDDASGAHTKELMELGGVDNKVSRGYDSYLSDEELDILEKKIEGTFQARQLNSRHTPNRRAVSPSTRGRSPTLGKDRSISPPSAATRREGSPTRHGRVTSPPPPTIISGRQVGGAQRRPPKNQTPVKLGTFHTAAYDSLPSLQVVDDIGTTASTAARPNSSGNRTDLFTPVRNLTGSTPQPRTSPQSTKKSSNPSPNSQGGHFVHQGLFSHGKSPKPKSHLFYQYAMGKR